MTCQWLFNNYSIYNNKNVKRMITERWRVYTLKIWMYQSYVLFSLSLKKAFWKFSKVEAVSKSNICAKFQFVKKYSKLHCNNFYKELQMYNRNYYSSILSRRTSTIQSKIQIWCRLKYIGARLERLEKNSLET